MFTDVPSIIVIFFLDYFSSDDYKTAWHRLKNKCDKQTCKTKENNKWTFSGECICFLSWRFIDECYIYMYMYMYFLNSILKCKHDIFKVNCTIQTTETQGITKKMHVCMTLSLIILQQREKIKAPFQQQFTVYSLKKTRRILSNLHEVPQTKGNHMISELQSICWNTLFSN